MVINKRIIGDITSSIGLCKVESGGILGRKKDTKMIDYYIFDHAEKENEYIPDVEKLNKALLEWANESIDFVGVIHSHQNSSQMKLSYADVEFARNILSQNRNLDSIYMLLYILKTGKLVSYNVSRDCIMEDGLLIF